MLHNFSSFGSPAVTFVKGKLSGVLKDVRSRGHLPFCVHLNCGLSTRSACVKVCYFMYWGCSGVVVQALCYKLVGRGFDSRWCHSNCSVT